MLQRIVLILLLILAGTVTASAQRGGRTPASEIRKVDFKNFNYGPLCSGDHKFFTPPVETLTLTKGRQEQGDALNYADLRSVKYADLDGDGAEEAFVVVQGQTAGSSGAYLTAFVYAWRNGRAEQIWSQCEENSAVSLKGKAIRFTHPEWKDDDAHCCFSYVTTDTYRWKGSAIVLVSTNRKRQQ